MGPSQPHSWREVGMRGHLEAEPAFSRETHLFSPIHLLIQQNGFMVYSLVIQHRTYLWLRLFHLWLLEVPSVVFFAF